MIISPRSSRYVGGGCLLDITSDATSGTECTSMILMNVRQRFLISRNLHHKTWYLRSYVNVTPLRVAC